jgi:hypothetical protein
MAVVMFFGKVEGVCVCWWWERRDGQARAVEYDIDGCVEQLGTDSAGDCF